MSTHINLYLHENAHEKLKDYIDFHGLDGDAPDEVLTAILQKTLDEHAVLVKKINRLASEAVELSLYRATCSVCREPIMSGDRVRIVKDKKICSGCIKISNAYKALFDR